MNRFKFKAASLVIGCLLLSSCTTKSASPPISDAEPHTTSQKTSATQHATTQPPSTPRTGTNAVISVYLGKKIASDNRIEDSTTTFAPFDTVYASVVITKVNEAIATPKIHAKWTYQDGQIVDETDTIIEMTGSGVTAFKIRKSDGKGLPEGKYSIEVKVNADFGNYVETKDFVVKN